MIDTKFIDDFISNNKQFPDNYEDSDLWKSIKQGLTDAGEPCTDKEAQGFGEWHCNSLSFYTLCKARGFIEFHYSTWVEKLYKAKLITKKGFLSDKLKIAKFFAFDDKFPELKYFYTYKDCMDGVGLDKEKGYNIKVDNNSGDGDHFMAGYVEEDLMVTDSGNRGEHKKARDVIPKGKFKWLLEV